MDKKSDFWEEWKNKTSIEKKAIKSIDKAKRILFKNIPKKKIFAVYIKGSFVRREMNEKSDVDIAPITFDNKTLEKIKRLQELKGKIYKPSELLPHSLEEFKQGKRHLKHTSIKGGVDIVLRNIHHYKLIYGKPLDITNYPMRSDLNFLKGHINAFRTKFIPCYREKKFGFSEIAKQVFFLVEREERVKGSNPPYSFEGLAKSIKDKNHIVHDALRFRLKPVKDKKEKEKFMKKLDKYLSELEEMVKKDNS